MAKKKDSNVSIAAVDRLLKVIDTKAVPVHVEAHGEAIDFEVKPRLDLGTFNSMLRSVVEASFVIDEETGEERYDSVYYHYAKQIAPLLYVANFKAATASDKLYQLANCPEVMGKINDIWDCMQRHEFETAVQGQVQFNQQELLATERRKLQQVVAQLDKANDLFAQFTAMFEGVDPRQMVTDMQKIAGMSEEQLAAAVVNTRDKDFVEQRKAALQVLK